MSRKLIAIPAYNEDKAIPEVLDSIRPLYPNFDLVVIDDGSTDNTTRVCRDYAVYAITHLKNLGYGAAVNTAILYAYQNDYSYLFFVDADGQHDIHYLRDLSSQLIDGEADYVLGSRFLHDTSHYKMPFLRKLGKNLFSRIIRFFTGLSLTDPTSGFTGFNRKAIEVLTHFSDFPYDYPDANLIIYLHNRGVRIKEVPVRMFENSEGTSMHSGLKPVYYIIKVLYSCFVYGFRGRRLK